MGILLMQLALCADASDRATVDLGAEQASGDLQWHRPPPADRTDPVVAREDGTIIARTTETPDVLGVRYRERYIELTHGSLTGVSLTGDGLLLEGLLQVMGPAYMVRDGGILSREFVWMGNDAALACTAMLRLEPERKPPPDDIGLVTCTFRRPPKVASED